MGNLLEKLISKKEKPILKETTLTDDDLVYLYQRFKGRLYLIRDDHLYRIEGKFSKIDSANPRVSLKCVSKSTKPILGLFQPYRELRNP